MFLWFTQIYWNCIFYLSYHIWLAQINVLPIFNILVDCFHGSIDWLQNYFTPNFHSFEVTGVIYISIQLKGNYHELCTCDLSIQRLKASTDDFNLQKSLDYAGIVHLLVHLDHQIIIFIRMYIPLAFCWCIERRILCRCAEENMPYFTQAPH